MKPNWDLVFHQEAVEVLFAARTREQQNLSRALKQLLANPYLKPDYEEHDDSGRALSVVLVGPWAITFWLDHFVSEIRIVRLEKTDS